MEQNSQNKQLGSAQKKAARILILLAAGLSMLLSIGIWFLADDKLAGIFVGTWVPSILALGTFLSASDGKQ
jgi:hypothetical protein